MSTSNFTNLIRSNPRLPADDLTEAKVESRQKINGALLGWMRNHYAEVLGVRIESAREHASRELGQAFTVQQVQAAFNAADNERVNDPRYRRDDLTDVCEVAIERKHGLLSKKMKRSVKR